MAIRQRLEGGERQLCGPPGSGVLQEERVTRAKTLRQGLPACSRKGEEASAQERGESRGESEETSSRAIRPQAVSAVHSPPRPPWHQALCRFSL